MSRWITEFTTSTSRIRFFTIERIGTGKIFTAIRFYFFDKTHKYKGTGTLLLNKKIAKNLKIEFPDSFIKKASRIIE